jgi:cytochrome P450 family 4
VGNLKQYFYIFNPSHFQIILNSTKHIEKSDEYSFMWAWLGDGLLVSNGRKWHQRRKIITPAFHFKILEDFVEIFDKQSDIFVANLTQLKPKTPFDIFPAVALCALDAICESAMGKSTNAQNNSDSEYVQAVKE